MKKKALNTYWLCRGGVGRILAPSVWSRGFPTPVHWGHFRFGYLRWGSESPWPGAASVPAQALGALCLFLSSMQGDHEIRTIR